MPFGANSLGCNGVLDLLDVPCNLGRHTILNELGIVNVGPDVFLGHKLVALASVHVG